MTIQSLLDYFRNEPKKTANVAKERLQIIVSHERTRRNGPNYLPMLQKELLAVITRYVHVDPTQVKVELGREGDYAILELNVTLPDNNSIHD